MGLTILSALLGACGGQTPARTHAPARTHTPTTTRRDPETARALLRIARQFNIDYADNRAASVYARWDARSQAILSRSAYIRRHGSCDTGSGPGVVEDAVRHGGWWLVHYVISGVTLTDYWSYQHGRWAFDLFRSNPSAVALYRLPLAKYRAAVGCPGRS